MEDAFRNLPDAERDALELIETLRFAPESGFTRRDLHLARMERSAAALGFPFRRERALDALARVREAEVQRVRLTLLRGGVFGLTAAPLPPGPEVWTVALSTARLEAGDPWLRHKTSRRVLYDRARADLPDAVDELLFRNRDGALCEGTITNLFLRRDGALLTPPLSAGLLPGVLRQELLESGEAREATLHPADLEKAEAVYVGNSLRGLIPVRLAAGGGPSAPRRP